MKCITLWQPWASLIAEGFKTIETRKHPHPWNGHLGETIGIHSAIKRPAPGTFGGLHCYDHEGTWWLDGRDNDPDSDQVWWLPQGHVLATATIEAVLPIGAGDYPCDTAYVYLGEPSGNLVLFERTDPPHVGGSWQTTDILPQKPFGDFRPGRWAILLTDITKIGPYPATGMQGMWEWDEHARV